METQQRKKSALNVSDDEASVRQRKSQELHEFNDEAPAFDPKTEREISKQATSALLLLFFYSVLMFTLPFGAFFGTRHYLFTYTDYSEFAATSLAVISSVITIYVIIGLYAWQAYREQDVVIPDQTNPTAAPSESSKKKK